VNCPAGKQVIGAGGAITIFTDSGEIEGTRGDVNIEDIKPNAALTSVTVLAREHEGGTAETWGVRAYAMCADPPDGLELVTETSEPDSDPASATAICPAGKNLQGTGGEISPGTGQVGIDDLRPNAALNRVTVAGLEDETGLQSNWTVTAYAICANP
jgi:hypothetical protein